MAKFRDRHNLFGGKLGVAPRPAVPAHWKVPGDYPSATRFWVEPRSGATSSSCQGDDWKFSVALKEWQSRHAGRIWVGRRLVARVGVDEARRRTKDLQTELITNIRTANSYLDVLVSIAYEACRLTRRAEAAEQVLVATTRRVIEVAALLGEPARDLGVAGDEAIVRAQAAARALDDLAETLKQTTSPMDRRFDPAIVAAAAEPGDKQACEWVRYATPPRRYRRADLNWLVASAVVTYLENKADASTAVACRRVSGYLDLLDVPFGARHASVHRAAKQ